MLTYKLATCEQYDIFWQFISEQAVDYMQMTLEETRHLFGTVGQTYGIYQEDALVGFYWIEERDNVLYLIGLVLASEFQGKGIGTQVLTMLATTYCGRMGTIELRVHKSNVRARNLYERLGYQTMQYMDDLGFYIMRCSLTA